MVVNGHKTEPFLAKIIEPLFQTFFIENNLTNFLNLFEGRHEGVDYDSSNE